MIETSMPEGEEKRPRFPTAAVIAFMLMGLWGCLSIYAARAFSESPAYFAGRQLLWLVLGSLCFSGAALLKFSIWLRLRSLLAGISLISLALVLLCGHSVNGMRGWFLFGDFLSLQPSEFAKPFFLLYCCGEFVTDRRTQESEQTLPPLKKTAGAAALFCLLLLLEPDFGTCLIFAMTFPALYWLAGGKLRHILMTWLSVLLAAGLFLWRTPYAWDRICAFFTADSELFHGSWHMRQFRYTLAQGGFGGSEHGVAVWANAYLPLAHSDSIYAAIVETTGLLGGLLVLGVFAAIILIFFRMAQKKGLAAPARLFISGVAVLYGLQALLHISVNVVLLPPTGITLPILSYGGSSLVSTLLAFGMLFSAANDSVVPEVEAFRDDKQEK